eukprot:TRINITY_DN32132_c0_g1_i1.p1 TRINITY_DN32132_c0_g1~~TRINITY_DN32132_c0_g1_i1.p1  ORF type:complete len:369 (+),score=38.77 TRINITY_DN32132_c0_g1_i1:44-1150(+)
MEASSSLLPTNPRNRKLCGYAAQVLISHGLSAILAEMVFSSEGFAFPGVFGAAEFATFALAPLLAKMCWHGPKAVKAVILGPAIGSFKEAQSFALCGLAISASHGAGLAANVRVNYTTAMLFTSVRLPAIVLFGTLLPAQGSRQAQTPCAAHIWAFCVAAGLVMFGFAEQRDAPRFSTSGLFLIAINLILGAGTFTLQQRMLQRSNAAADSAPSTTTRSEKAERLMFVQYAVGANVMLIYAIFSGEMAAFVTWSRLPGRHGPVSALIPVFCGALLTAVGVRALLHISMEFDAARSSVITSVRKICTFVISFILFPKVFSLLHFCGVLLTAVSSVAIHRTLDKHSHLKGERLSRISPPNRVVATESTRV